MTQNRPVDQSSASPLPSRREKVILVVSTGLVVGGGAVIATVGHAPVLGGVVSGVGTFGVAGIAQVREWKRKNQARPQVSQGR